LAPTFEKIDGSAPTLGDIIPGGDSVGYGGEIIQTFDSDNYVDGYYTYYCEDMGKPEGAGWYDEDENCWNSKELGGKGIGVLFESGAATVQFSGKVVKGKSVIEVANSGLSYVSNPTPVEMDIQKFVPTTDGIGYGGEIIQTFDSENYVDGYYTYYCEDMGKSEGAGWYNEDEEKVTVPFTSGFGFLLDCGGDLTIELPAVLN